MKYKKIGSHYFGFIDISISILAQHFPEFFNQLSMLITCIDSNPQVTKLEKWINYIDSKKWNTKVVGSSVWIPSQYVSEILSDVQTFHGFDEVYLLRDFPKVNFSTEHSYTTDGFNFAKSVPAEFLRRFHNLSAIRYLSDGCGMNFGCESIEIVERLKRLE